MKKQIALLLTMTMVISLTACSSSSDNKSTETGEKVIEEESASIAGSIDTSLAYTAHDWYMGTMDEYDTTTGYFTKQTDDGTVIIASSNSIAACEPQSNVEFCFAYNVYESLLQYNNETGELEGLLATDWYYDDENLHITLRDNVKFHDGTILNADDVLYTFERLANSTATVKSAFQKIDFDASYKEGDLNLVLVFKEPSAAFLNYLATGYSGIMSKEFCEEVGDDYSFLDGDAGCGAYYIVETVTGNSQTFKRFDDYWGGAPDVDTVIYRMYKDFTAMFIDYENGDIDIAMRLNYDSVSRIMGEEITDTALYIAPYSRTNGIQLSVPGTALENVLVRQAIASAINYDELVTGVYQSEWIARVATSIFTDSCKYKVDVGVHEYNPEKSKELLAEAGYDSSNPLTVTMLSSTNANFSTMCEIIQNYLVQVGINVELTVEESSVTNSFGNKTAIPAEYMLSQAQTPMASVDADEYLASRAAYGLEIGTFSGSKGITDEYLSNLIVEAGECMDDNERVEMYEEIQQKIFDDVYILPISVENDCVAVRTYLDGFTMANSSVPLWKNLMVVK